MFKYLIFTEKDEECTPVAGFNDYADVEDFEQHHKDYISVDYLYVYNTEDCEWEKEQDLDLEDLDTPYDIWKEDN